MRVKEAIEAIKSCKSLPSGEEGSKMGGEGSKMGILEGTNLLNLG